MSNDDELAAQIKLKRERKGEQWFEMGEESRIFVVMAVVILLRSRVSSPPLISFFSPFVFLSN